MATFYCSANLTSGSNNGLDLANAFQGPDSIQQAIDSLTENNSIIYVDDGIYNHISITNFTCTIQSLNGREKTFIDGGAKFLDIRSGKLSPECIPGENAFRCIYSTLAQNLTIDGFTIQNGITIENDNQPASGSGAALCRDSTGTIGRNPFSIKNSRIVNCLGISNGAIINSGNIANTVVENCCCKDSKLLNLCQKSTICLQNIIRKNFVWNDILVSAEDGTYSTIYFSKIHDNEISIPEFNSNAINSIGCIFHNVGLMNCTTVRNKTISSSGTFIVMDNITGDNYYKNVRNSIFFGNIGYSVPFLVNGSYNSKVTIATNSFDISENNTIPEFTNHSNNLYDYDPKFIDLQNDDFKISRNSLCKNFANYDIITNITSDIDGTPLDSSFATIGCQQYEKQQFLYVDCNAKGNQSGANLENAFLKIQDAFDVVENGDIIYVNDGTYHEALYCPEVDFTLSSLNGSDKTIIDASEAVSDDRVLLGTESKAVNVGKINGDGRVLSRKYDCDSNISPKIIGFTLQGGHTTNSWETVGTDTVHHGLTSGACIYGTFHLKLCTMKNNSSVGASIFGFGNSNSILENCFVKDNTSIFDSSINSISNNVFTPAMGGLIRGFHVINSYVETGYMETSGIIASRVIFQGSVIHSTIVNTNTFEHETNNTYCKLIQPAATSIPKGFSLAGIYNSIFIGGIYLTSPTSSIIAVNNIFTCEKPSSSSWNNTEYAKNNLFEVSDLHLKSDYNITPKSPAFQHADKNYMYSNIDLNGREFNSNTPSIGCYEFFYPYSKIIYCDANLSTGLNDGSSWENAIQGSNSLNVVLNSNKINQHDCLIAINEGTYSPAAVNKNYRKYIIGCGELSNVIIDAGGRWHNVSDDIFENPLVEITNEVNTRCFNGGNRAYTSVDNITFMNGMVLSGNNLAGVGVASTAVYNCRITSCLNTTSNNAGGGAWYCEIYNTMIDNNRARVGGGTIACNLHNVSVINNIVAPMLENMLSSTGFYSGGCNFGNGFNIIENSLVSGNNAYEIHGGITGQSYNNKVSCINCVIDGNKSGGDRGGVSFCYIYDSEIKNNITGILKNGRGAGISISKAYNCKIHDNIAGLRKTPPTEISGNASKYHKYYGAGGGADSSELINCEIYNNKAWRGGGVYNCKHNYGNGIINCNIHNNFASTYGGGADSSIISNSIISQNSCYYGDPEIPLGTRYGIGGGGGFFECSCYNSKIIDNEGAFCAGARNTVFYSCYISGNHLTYEGPVAESWGSQAPATASNSEVYVFYGGRIVNCLVENNIEKRTSLFGCTIRNSIVRNNETRYDLVHGGYTQGCLIIGNKSYILESDYQSGRFVSRCLCRSSHYNNTFISNDFHAMADGWGGNTNLYNNIFYKNLSDARVYSKLSDKVTYDGYAATYFENNLFGEENASIATAVQCKDNLSVIDPEFVDEYSGDFHLKASSPCIGAGSYGRLQDVVSSFNTDLDKKIFNEFPPIGCYDYFKNKTNHLPTDFSPLGGNFHPYTEFEDIPTKIYITTRGNIKRTDEGMFIIQSQEHGIEVDYGDGSPVESMSGTGNVKFPAHEFPEFNTSYVITIRNRRGNKFTLGQSRNNQTCLFGTYSSTYQTSWIDKVELGNGCEAISDHGLHSSPITDLICKCDDLTAINYISLRACGQLSNLELSRNLKRVGDRNFEYNNVLSSIYFRDKIQTIGTLGFSSSTSKIKYIRIGKDIQSFAQKWIPSKSDLSIEFDYGIYKLPDYTFSGLSCDITIKNLPTSIYEYGNYAYYNNTAITSAAIPSSVTSLGKHIFNGCSNLSSIKFDPKTKLTYIPEFFCANTSNLRNFDFVSSITKLEKNAFNYSGISSLYIPATLTSIYMSERGWIENGSFNGLSALDYISVNTNNPIYNDGNGSNCLIETATSTLLLASTNSIIPNTVKHLGNEIFNYENCKKLSSIIIPDSVETIGDACFTMNNNVTDITIGSGISSIGMYTFYETKNLSSITILAKQAPTIDILDGYEGEEEYTFGEDGCWCGQKTAKDGINVLRISVDATGYDEGIWKDYLCNPDKCGFHIERI